MDDFSNTTVIDSQTIRFRIDESYDPDGIEDLDNGDFYVRIHSRRYLGCGVVWREQDMDYGDIKDRIFEVPLEDIGYYSIELTVEDSSGAEGEARFYFYTKVSPQGLGPEPGDNHEPVPHVTIRHLAGGSGSYTDPYLVSGSTMYFNMLGSVDPDGQQDLEQGLFAYDINADGIHPVHSGTRTHQQMQQLDFTFDMNQMGSETRFYIDAYAIDRWGRAALHRFHCVRVH